MALNTKRALFLSARRVEDIEYLYPLYRLREEGVATTTVSPDGKAIAALRGHVIEVDGRPEDVSSDDFDILVIPGGFAPDAIRVSEPALQLVRDFDTAGKPIALICHAGWVGVSAGIVKGRRVTAYKAIKDDLVNAGCIWEDAPAVVDGNLISARDPADMGPWCKAMIAALSD
jgi:protease I